MTPPGRLRAPIHATSIAIPQGGIVFTISRTQRTVLRSEILASLGPLTGIVDAVQEGLIAEAKRMRADTELRYRLLDDIGWAEEPGPESIEITVELHELARVVAQLVRQAGADLMDILATTPKCERCLARDETEELLDLHAMIAERERSTACSGSS